MDVQGGRGVPGVGGTRVGPEGCYTGYPAEPSRYPYLVIFSLKAYTYGQMKAILRFPVRFPRKGPELTQN